MQFCGRIGLQVCISLQGLKQGFATLLIECYDLLTTCTKGQKRSLGFALAHFLLDLSSITCAILAHVFLCNLCAALPTQSRSLHCFALLLHCPALLHRWQDLARFGSRFGKIWQGYDGWTLRTGATSRRLFWALWDVLTVAGAKMLLARRDLKRPKETGTNRKVDKHMSKDLKA